MALPILSGCTSSKVAGQDVAVSACRDDPAGGRPTADGTIVNHSSKASSYLIDVTFTDAAGNKVSEGGATVGKVDPGATAIFHAEGAARAKGPLSCKVARVTRTLSP